MYDHLGTLAAHCGMDCKDSKLGTGPDSPDPGELDSVGGSPGLILTPLADETDMRLARVVPPA